ncbi:hypothetical protein CCR75_003784 [Bremia lactucae]|uniref:Calcineurin-like phosphoesterase domain-containing protein n=1 Tax=Bremia lactucae TaxID=4779 RepID=A0A976NYT0_BRELC|nr:hypothetical protein CCR75_003784 [Bremia lactucae]
MVTNGVLKRIPHDASPEQIAAMVSASLALLMLACVSFIKYLYGFIVSFIVTLMLAIWSLRWVYQYGAGAFGWNYSWLRSSNRILNSLYSNPKDKETLRVVCISDTHAKHRHLRNLPDGDLLLHCGDFTNRGTHDEISDFNEWLGTLPYRYKVVIAGNHDVCMDAVEYDQHWDKAFRHTKYNDPSLSKALLTNCTYLENRSIIIEKVKIYGSPMTPPISGRAGAFNVARGFGGQQHWAKVPADVDVLITHGPPHGILDLTFTGLHVGSETLLKETMSRIRPRFHVFGHIHESYGATRVGKTVFINAASSTLLAKPVHAPIVVDIPIAS